MTVQFPYAERKGTSATKHCAGTAQFFDPEAARALRSEHRGTNDSWATEIMRITRRRELAYRTFVCSCVVVCLLLVLAFCLKWEW
jgi:hypothetical protein